MLTLWIANRNYSSWSFRPWFALKAAGIDFEDRLVPFDDSGGNPAFRTFSPTGKVPCLAHGEVLVWESLAILEYLADLHPDRGLWPADRAARAHMRAIAAEMHAGFQALRSACPMNMRRPPAALSVDDRVRADVARIEAIWEDCLTRWGGPYLSGARPGAADAMYAPVVSRFATYRLSDHPAARRYGEAMRSHPAWIEWEGLALAEPWVVPADEV